MRVYISSTTEDLGEHRDDVATLIRDLGHEPVYMGEYPAVSLPPLTKVLNDVEACDAYVGIVAFRYGASPSGHDRSYVELEFEHARKFHKPTWIFILDKDSREYSIDSMDLENTPKLNTFRERLLRQDGWTVARFKSKQELLDKAKKTIESEAKCLLKIERLPATPSQLFGRRSELKRLDDEWNNSETHVLCLIGFAGYGKSSLFNAWLNEFLKSAEYRGARRILGWSFYAGGSTTGDTSADPFMDATYQWLREEVPKGVDPAEAIKIPGTPWEKGIRLAELIQEKKTLLILDGLEAIQRKTSQNMGELNDLAMKAFLRALAVRNPGLCLITSRLRVAELQTFFDGTVQEIHLGQLSDEAAVQLLESIGVHGSPSELLSLAREYGNHPFSLRAVGNLLKRVCKGNASDRKKLATGTKLGEAVASLLSWYENCLGEAELDALRMLSVFRGPAPTRALQNLRAEPVIHGLTDHVSGQSDMDWNDAVSGLVELELVSEGRGSQEESYDPDGVDLLNTHALVREHFSRQLQTTSPQGWIEANDRLFEYYRSVAPERPADLATMLPLFRAVAHGCQAGRHQEAWDDVEWKRIRREDLGWCVVNLGAWSEDLVALTNFYENCWDRPVGTLNKVAKAWLLTETAFDLRGLGRLSDAIRPLTDGLAAHKANEDWWAACDAVGNLSELLTLWGDLGRANVAARESIQLAEKAVELAVSEDDLTKAKKTLATNIATLAEVLHYQGDFPAAEQRYHEADQLYTSVSGLKCIHGARGFHFCGLLLDLGKTEEVDWRAPAALEIDEKLDRKYGVGLAQLNQAESLMVGFRRGQITDLAPAHAKLQEAYDYLAAAGFQEHVCRARLAMGRSHFLSGHFDQALSDIDDTVAAAERGQMRLLLIDGQLEKARTLLEMDNPAEARKCIEAATKGAKISGYHRRDAVVAELLKRCDP